MIAFGQVKQSTDKKGNAYVSLQGETGKKLVVLAGSSRLRFLPGTRVEFYPEHLKKGERVLFSDTYMSHDFAFYDSTTRDLLVVGRNSPHTFCVDPYEFYQRTRGLWAQMGTIEETEPRLEYYHARDFNFLSGNPIQELSRLLGIPENLRIRFVQGAVPGKQVNSLLSVPHMDDGLVTDRIALGNFLQKHLDSILRTKVQ